MHMKKLIFIALAAILFALPIAQAKEVEIIVWAPANANERYRVQGVILAANILNEEFKIEGRDIKVKVVQVKTFEGATTWQELKKSFALAVEAGKGPHIIVGGHEDISVWGSAGLIHPIEEVLDLEQWPFNDVYPNLWPIMSWNGQIWAVPQDAESRPFYAWIPHLKAIGYSDADIEAMPANIKAGRYTLKNVLEDAKKMQEAGLVEKGYGFYPRATKGPDYWQFYAVNGGEMFDEKTGKLVLDQDALIKYYQFFHDAVFKYGVTKKNHLGMNWDQWYHEVANGKAGLWHGGTWHYARYTRKEGLTDFFDKVMFSLIPSGGPGGRATTITHPLIYAISTRAKTDEEIEICGRLITIVSEPRLNTLHAIASAHLGISTTQENIALYADDRWTAEATELLKSAISLPNSVDFGQYDQLVWKGLTAAWSGTDPQEATNTVVSEMKATMGQKVIIR